MLIHVVRTGDTIFSIASEYGVDPVRLMADNDVPSDGALAVGQTLVVRFPRTVHAVAAGDTLASIARQYGVTVRQLWQNNWFLGGGYTLRPGQTLVIDTIDQRLGTAVVNGYAYPWTDPALLAAETPFVSYVTPFTWGITADGSLYPLDDQTVRTIARSRGAGSILHLSTYTEDDRFDALRAALVLTDYTVQTRLIAQLRSTVETIGYAGVDVDFEYLPASLADAYAAFLGRLRQSLSGRFVWAALAPKTSPDQPGLLYEGHDYAAVAAAVDAVLLMTYEWGYTYGPPMAVAPLPNVRAVLDYAVTAIPPEKILLGVPNYGYDWPLPFVQGSTRAQSISNQDAIRLAVRYRAVIRWDDTARAPWFTYTDSAGTAHRVWFEDARSMEAKFRLIAQYGFLGAGIWNLSRPFSQTWLTLHALYDLVL